MAKPSLHIGSNNWSIKDGKLLGYRETDKNKFVPKEGDFERLGIGSYTDRNGILQTGIKTVEGGDLVNNGQFTDKVLGSELVTNGDFAINDNWTLSTGATIGGGVLTLNSGSSMSAKQSVGLQAGKFYEVSFEVTAYTSGGVRITIGNGFSTNIESAAGVYTEIIQVSDVGTGEININTLGGANLSVDNVTVRESNSAWNFSDVSVDISGNLLNFTASDVGEQASQTLQLTSTKTFKIEYTISNYTSGGIQVYAGGQLLTERTAAGVYTETIVSANSGDLFYIQASQNGTTASLSEIKVVELNEITDNFNKPRIDFSEDSEGLLLLERQSTNLLTYSEDWTIYAKTNATVTANQTIAPDGKLTADLLTATANSGQVQHAIAGSAATDYNTSIWVKRKTGTGIVSLRSVENASTPINVTNEWQRFDITTTSTTATIRIGVRLEVAGDEVYIWGGQLEQGLTATSYIPTNGTSVTRLQDECINFGTINDFNDSEGVLFLRLRYDQDTIEKRVYVNNNGGSEYFYVRFTDGLIQFVMFNGSNILVITDNNYYPGFNDFAFKYGGGVGKIYVNGVQTATDTYVGGLTGLEKFNFASPFDSAFLFADVKNTKYYKSIADAQVDLPYIS